MSMETGTGAGSAYEYVVAEKQSASLRMKKIALILLYVVWALGFLAVGLLLRIVAPLLAFIPITLWILVFFTWRFTQVEYEFSFLLVARLCCLMINKEVFPLFLFLEKLV